ncbi:hypothetical protein QTP88_004249 [Uroleucon formosanum]
MSKDLLKDLEHILQKKKKNKRPSNVVLTPPYTSKNRFAPLLTLQVNDNTDGTADEISTQELQVRTKIPPIYVYNISDYENFHTSLANITFDEFSITNTKSALKLNMYSIDDYRTATKLFDDSGIEYHTYQFPENKQLSVIIRNLPVNISEACIYKELVELKFEVASVTRLQNKFKTPIPIVAVLLSKSSTEIYSLNRLLHCVVAVEPRQPSKGIPQCTNCQRFSHTKKFCHLPPRCVKCADRVTQSRAMGGVAILVRAQIKQQVIPNPNLLCLEAVAVLIKLNNRYVTIVSAYQPPSRQMHISDYDKIMSLDNSIIMAGDLNAKHTNWGCRVSNPNGTKLLSFIANTPYAINAPNEPTYFPSDCNRQPDILDILLIKSIPFSCTQEALAELDSDHIPIKITINSSSQSYQSNNSLFKGKPNWNIFSNQINTNLIIPKTIPTIQAAEQMSEHLTAVIADAARACSKPTLHNTKDIGYLPPYLFSLIQRKHQARRIWQNQRNTENKKLLNKLTKEVRTALQNNRVSSYNSYLLNMYPGDSNLWKETKRLLNQEINIIPPLRTANQLVISDADKCNVFSKMLYNTFSTNQITHINNERRVHKFLDLPDYSVQTCMDYVTPNEIKLIVKNLPNKKAPGHDHITNLMFKKLPTKGLVFMTSLFNFLLRVGHFPLSWKLATVILIKKPGKDKSNPDSYRPISLLTSLSKIFEKVIHTRLQNYLDSADVIPKFQFGFRSNHSTVQQLFRITEHISNSFEKHCHTGAVFIDVSKAFDKVWHKGLLYKLKSFNTPKYLFNIINSFLTNRQFSVKINDNFSVPRTISAGVPQGSKLGPILFNIFISDIPQSPRTNIALFADDTTIYSESRNVEAITNNLQDHLNLLATWCNSWKIHINASKSSAVIFSLRRYSTPPPLRFGNDSIPWQSSVKYLGVTLDKRLTWGPHIASKLQQAYQRLSMLFPILNKKSVIQKKCSILIYKQLLRSLITYACPIWGNCSATHLRKIQIFQNKVLRIITNAPWFVRNENLHKDLRIIKIQDHIKALAENFHSSLHKSTGSIHFNLHIHPPPQRRLKRGRPHDLIR